MGQMRVRMSENYTSTSLEVTMIQFQGKLN